MQLGSMFISNCNITLHVLDAFCIYPQEHLKTVVAASGVRHAARYKANKQVYIQVVQSYRIKVTL